MSVDYHFLSVSEVELRAVLDAPASVRELVGKRDAEHLWLGPESKATACLTAESEDDPLAFAVAGAPDEVSGWIGRYDEEHGDCEVDMGYGPGSYYRNPFLVEVAERLARITPELFARHCDIDWLEEAGVYPSGWHDDGRREELVEAFTVYRDYVLAAAKSGRHLLVWCA